MSSPQAKLVYMYIATSAASEPENIANVLELTLLSVYPLFDVLGTT